MALADKLVDVFTEFGIGLKEDLQQSLRNKGVTYGGGDSRLSNAIKFAIIQRGDKVVFQLLMPKYGFAVDGGRKAAPVSKEGQIKIKEWAKRKNIVKKFQTDTLKARVKKQDKAKAKDRTGRKYKTLKQVSFEKAAEQLTYLIARKKKKERTEGNHFYTEVIDKLNTTELQEQLAAVMKSEILIEIKK